MKEKADVKLTVRVAETIAKTLHSKDSADRLVGAVVSLWRRRSDGSSRNTKTLILDFDGVPRLSESAASVLVEFRLEFSEDRKPEIKFSNMSDSVKKTFAAVEKSTQRIHKRINASSKKKTSFMIEI